MPPVFRNVGNIRIDYVPSAGRPPAKNWSECDVIRIRAYTGEGQKLHRGAEYPLNGPTAFEDLIRTLQEVYDAGRLRPAGEGH